MTMTNNPMLQGTVTLGQVLPESAEISFLKVIGHVESVSWGGGIFEIKSNDMFVRVKYSVLWYCHVDR